LDEDYATQMAAFEKSEDVVSYEKPEQGGVVDLSKPSVFEGKTVNMDEVSGTKNGLSSASDAPDLFKGGYNTIPDKGIDNSDVENSKEDSFFTEEQKLDLTKAGASLVVGVTATLLLPEAATAVGIVATAVATTAVVDIPFEYYKAYKNGENLSNGQILLNGIKETGKDLPFAIADPYIVKGAQSAVKGGIGILKIKGKTKDLFELIAPAGTTQSLVDTYNHRGN
jgi:hypothetical protein